MNYLALIEFIFIWITVATWLCWKRNWYKPLVGRNPDCDFTSFCCYLFLPLYLIIAFFKEFIYRKWDNN